MLHLPETRMTSSLITRVDEAPATRTLLMAGVRAGRLHVAVGAQIRLHCALTQRGDLRALALPG